MANKKYDIIVIGSGPGGYVAAIRAAQLGFSTACIEKYPSLGGTCLNVGCIPSKTLLQSTEYYSLFQNHAKTHGMSFSNLLLDFTTLMQRKNEVVKGLTESIASLFKKNKIDRYEGQASFIDPHTIKIDNQEISGNSFILATGSKPIQLPFLPFDEKIIVSSTGVLSLEKIPKKMLVIGAGVIGVELASVYSRLGTEVTIVEMLDRICPTMDHSVSKALLQIYKKQGLNFFLSSKVTSGEIKNGKCKINFIHEEKEHEELVDVVLVAVGRKPYTEGLGLENIGIETIKGFVQVDSEFRTKYKHILAIGDVIEGPMLAHKASEEGVAAVEIIAGLKTHMNYMTIPNVIYTHPEVACVGLTEGEVKESGLNAQVGTFFFRGNPRARCSDDTEGFVKVIGDQDSGRLLGMHIIGAHASELIAEGVVAMEMKMTLEEIARTSHAHPTLSEAIKDATLAALKRPIHG